MVTGDGGEQDRGREETENRHSNQEDNIFEEIYVIHISWLTGKLKLSTGGREIQPKWSNQSL